MPLFLTQFFGALNDNLFKNALLVMIVSASITGVAAETNNTNALVNLAAGLFICRSFYSLPFLASWPTSMKSRGLSARLNWQKF